MKKYYDAMYHIFHLFHLIYDECGELSWRHIDIMYDRLDGVLEVATMDREVAGGTDFDSLLSLKRNLIDVAKVYFLKD